MFLFFIFYFLENSALNLIDEMNNEIQITITGRALGGAMMS